ncbi:hypothetical protein [Thermococcus sp.]|uniref:hypothetical protein n=1 Tax=Thermococcus sp. TaxID=35749 RepID=UPI002621F14F|nr:hypothetical protein [Thermococcus sp.]
MYGHPVEPALTGLGTLALFGFLFALFVAGLILAFSAKLVGIKDASIVGAMVAIVGGGILGAIVGGIVALVFSIAGPMGIALGWLAFVVTYVWVIKVVFHTDWLRAFLAWLIAIVVELIMAGLLSVAGVASPGMLHP